MCRAASLLTIALVALAGCGTQGDSTPVACQVGAGAYLKALAKAPREVKLAGETPISECLAQNQTGGDLAAIGAATVAAATQLNAAARGEPGGPANVELGYLLGAATRGAEDTEGIHAELLRRLTAAARYAPRGKPLPPAFRRAYRHGYAAGSARG